MVKILLIQLDRFGDNLFIVPLIKGIRHNYPDSHITALVRKEVKDILMGYKEVDSVMTADWLDLPACLNGYDESEIIINGYRYLKGIIEGMRGNNFDRIINLNFNKMTTLVTSLLNVPDSIGFTTGGDGERIINGLWPNYMGCVVQTREYNPFHIVDVYKNFEQGATVEDMSGFQINYAAEEHAMKLLQEEGMVNETIPPPLSPLPQGEGRFGRQLRGEGQGGGELQRFPSEAPIIALQPGASNRRRIWPKERFSELAGLLLKSGIKVVILGTNSEKDITQTIINNNPYVIDLTGRTTFTQLAAVLKRCDILVSNDTGTAHLSSAVGTRVIGLYMCHAYPIETGPYGRGHITISPVMDCYPCKWKEECLFEYKCRDYISAGDVFSVINHTLNPNNPLTCNIENIEVNTSIFDNDGFISYVPLVKRPLKFNDILMLAYKRLWKEMLDNRNGISVSISEIIWLKETFDITGMDFSGMNVDLYNKTEDLISALRKLECLADRGLRKSQEILTNIFSNEGRDVNTIQEGINDLDIIDSLINENGISTEYISPLTTFNRMQKACIKSDNPIQILRETMELYRMLKLYSSGMILIVNEIITAVFQNNGFVNV